jgi:dihydrofolate synthase/folylpolyglutamate synthase
MNYQQCLEYLDQASKFGIKLGLENVSLLLEAVGSPQQSFPSVLVAGTNGKGSVCAMIHSALRGHGFRVGLYTSPHLVRVEERIRVNQDLISSEAFCELLNFLRHKVESLLEQGRIKFPPTYFELLTCLAFLYFAREKVDLAVLEVGLGGRLDATNVVSPVVSVITTVSLDHQEYLGPTIGQIAGEKAGIIKPGVPVVCGYLPSAALEVVERKAAEVGAPLIKVFGRGRWFKLPGAENVYVFSSKGEKFIFRPGLRGQHQARNAAVAITALQVLSERWRPLDKAKIIEGIEKVTWEGRLEKIADRPAVYLDGAHNEGGARALRQFWEKQGRPSIVLVFSILKDKAIRRVARQLFPLAQKVILTSINSPRGARPEEIFRSVADLNNHILVEPEAAKALELAKKLAGEKGTVLITGSLYLVGEIKKYLTMVQAGQLS